MVDNGGMANGFRSAVLEEPSLMPISTMGMPGQSSSTMTDQIYRTPYAGNVRALPPPLPQMPSTLQANQFGFGNAGSFMGNYNSGFGGGYGGGYGGFGGGYGGGYGGYGGFGSGYGGGMYNRFGLGGGMNPMDPETQFIQLAEASSRPAFASIESLVSAIGNIAAMLDSTFFALTSSFRAILGVAANFGRLRGVFAQFWQTFAIYRGLTWIYKKILYWLRISNLDPSSDAFKKAFAEASQQHGLQPNGAAPKLPRKGQSPWPVLAFMSFIFTAPYLIMKLLGTVTNTAQEEARNPAKWVQPIETVALYDFQARNPSELTIRAGQCVRIAPKEIQNTLGLLNTGWAIATTDGQTAGIVPINYVKSPQQLRQERQQFMKPDQMHTSLPRQAPMSETAAQLMQPDLNVSSFPAPPTEQSMAALDFDIAPQPMGPGALPPTTTDIALAEGFA